MLGHARRTALASLTAACLLASMALPAAAAPEHAFAPAGEETSGGESLAQAPTLTPGVYRDTLTEGSQDPEDPHGAGTTRYYRVSLEDGQRLHAAATIAAPAYADGLPEESEPLDLSTAILTADGDTCQDGSGWESGETGDGDGVITSARMSDPVGEDCAGGDLFVAVTRGGARVAETPLPMELQLSIEPASAVGGDPVVEDPRDRTTASPVAPESTEPITGGTSPAAALAVEPESYVLELSPGEVSTLRLPVARGQELRWRTEIASDTGESPGYLTVNAYNAAREMVSIDGGRISIGERGDVDGGSTVAPIDPGNRSAGNSNIASAWLPGEHIIQVQRLQRPEGAGDGGQPIRLILTLETSGTAADDTTEADYLELGDWQPGAAKGLDLGVGADGGWLRIGALAAAGVLGLVALATGIPGLILLRRRA